MDRPKLLLTFSAVVGLIAPGTALLWAFNPRLIIDQSLAKLLWLSFVLTCLPVFICFVILSVLSFMLKIPRTTQDLYTEFTIAIFPTAIGYFSVALLVYFFELNHRTGAIVALGLIVCLLLILVGIRKSSPNNQIQQTPKSGTAN